MVYTPFFLTMFFSYGGTSLLMLLGEMGVVLSVSRQGGAEKV